MLKNCDHVLPCFVVDFFEDMDAHPGRYNKRLKKCRRIIERVFEQENLQVDLERYEKYINLGKYLGFGDGFLWERFLIGLFLCTYTEDGQAPRWDRLVCYVGRGAGKDGLISWMALALVSPYNPEPLYDVDIGAFNEAQALRPVEAVRKALEKQETKLKKFFYWTKEKILGRKNGGEIHGWANNSKGLDGLRSGIVILDEIHAYENNATIEVFKSALGKTADPREAYFTTEGYIVDGPLDTMIKTGDEELDRLDTESTTLWFLCSLDPDKWKDQIEDEEQWYKANPSLAYKPALLRKLRSVYKDWKAAPSVNVDFVCKRMNIKQTKESAPVTSWENILATNRPLSPLAGRECVVGIDFSKTTDWMAVTAHFKDGEIREDVNHAWICKQSPELWRLKCPYEDWERMGLVTVVDEPEISPQIVADYIRHLQASYRVKMVAIDSFRFTILAEALAALGFTMKNKNLKLIRPSDIIRVVPIIDRCFARHLFAWDDQPCLRWATNNTCLVPTKKSALTEDPDGAMTGNFIYGKIEHHTRKTDPFMSLVAAFTVEDTLTGFKPTAARRRVRAVTY